MAPQREPLRSRIVLAFIALVLLLSGAFGLLAEATSASAHTASASLPILSVSPSNIAPGSGCTSKGPPYECYVILSGSNFTPKYGSINWSASVPVSPPGGVLYPPSNDSVQVTISGLRCADETIIFSGTSRGVSVKPFPVVWSCTPPTQPPTPTPRPKPTLTPTAVSGVTPTATAANAPTATPIPTKGSTATPGPTATAANNSGGFTGLNPFHPGGPGGGSGFPLGDALTIAALLLGLLAFLLYLQPHPGAPGSVLSKLRSLIIPDSLRRR